MKEQLTTIMPKLLKLAVVFAVLFSQAEALAQTSYRLSFGALSDDYPGRPAWTVGPGQDGAAAELLFRSGPMTVDMTVARGFDMPVGTVPEFDARLTFRDVWAVGVGKTARHWSPSRYTSLILSDNALSFPAAYLAKTRATQSDMALFGWLGPWSGELFVGQTSDDGQPDGAMFAGLRFTFQPTPRLEVDLVRTIQFGGAGQPGGLGAFTRALLGGTNEGAAAAANQMAGVGLSYKLDGAYPTRLYAQIVGEDEAGGLPSCLIYLAGIETRFGAGNMVTLETVDTRVDTTRNGHCGPNTAYNNATYSYLNKGRVMGAAIGSEGRSIHLRGRQERSDWSLDWGLGYYQINDAADPDHLLSTKRVSGPMVSLGVSRDLLGGELTGLLAYQGFALDRVNSPRGLRVGLGFAKSF